MPALADVAREKCHQLAEHSRKRVLQATLRIDGRQVSRDGKVLISFSCNDYLGLSHHPEVVRAAMAATEHYGVGAGASRLVTGNYPLYSEFEQALANWHQKESALVFGAGYLANLGIIPALVGKSDLIIADKLVHACLLDGARLSGATLQRFAHNDVADAERVLAQHRAQHRHCLIITDEVFSMDGDRAPLAELAALARTHDAWLMADGAHALVPSQHGVDIKMGTLSKGFGGYGGYVCAAREVIELLATSARSFLFSTGLPPAVIAAAHASLAIMQTNPELANAPLARATEFIRALALPDAQSPIVPLILGDERVTLSAAQALQEEGFLVVAIRPPTVPEGTSRLRFTFSALHTEADIDALVSAIKRRKLR